jgi:hypothetical protein
MRYTKYDKQDLFEKIEKLEIIKTDNLVITKYDGRVINSSVVSSRYEIFDIVKYLKEKIESIENNFKISSYNIKISKGIQHLRLLSDSVNINGMTFYKSFYILNSTDKSRRLSFNIGLFSDIHNLYFISGINSSLSKKHLKGVTDAAESAFSVGSETFNEQINSLESLVGHRVLFSKIREVILGDSPKDINHRKFDAFKNSIRYSKLELTKKQINLLYSRSESITSIDREDDFYIDAFWTLQVYLKIFNKEDSHIIKNECDRIMNITQWAVRNAALESLGI